MEITIQERANDILSSINASIMTAISNSFKSVHPSKRLKNIKISNPCFLVGIGKNAEVQTRILMRQYPDLILGYRIHQIRGYSSSNIKDDKINSNLPHPIPDETTFQYTRETIQKLQNLDKDVEIHFLISGGGSAAYAINEEGINPEQYQEIIRLAMIAGYSIEELNLIRSLIDKVKGGKTAKLLEDYTIKSWISSDVVSDDPRFVASGPITPGLPIDNTIINWLNRLFLSLNVEISLDLLVKKLKFELKNDPKWYLLTTRLDLINTLQSEFEKLNFQVMLADTSLIGSIELISSQMTQLIHQFSKISNRIIIYSGEPTINLTSSALQDGRGGRISAISCLISKELNDIENVTFIGIATDGKDGSSPISGYVVNSETSRLLEEFGKINQIINKGDSGAALNALKTGLNILHTDINFLDIYIIIIS